ncbi:nucleotidyltransferase domain-containing protein [Archangium lipolyticum]|uniref:nucleotidyltransferase domain-containing protein n=1 Tax=Archangium lipolyticum TaxID=2970465 RepID=UPI00214A170C|nr:nucleotidyltransferase domain-containing protein [Archangium lipolyticum]
MVEPDSTVPPLAREWAARFSSFEQVRAVALGGSSVTGAADPLSDLDLIVYASPPPPAEARRALILPTARRAEIDNTFFGTGDEWIDSSGQGVDTAWWSPEWMEDQLERVLVRFEASLGYTTCFWHTLRNSRVLFDRTGWLARLQDRARGPYPEPLRRAIVAKNHPVLRSKLSSYLEQIELALRRADPVSVQHRVTALLASYFDILFAVNRVPHPGEKRLLAHIGRLCPKRPPALEPQVKAVIRAVGQPEQDLLPNLHALLDGLDALLVSEGLPTDWNVS